MPRARPAAFHARAPGAAPRRRLVPRALRDRGSPIEVLQDVLVACANDLTCIEPEANGSELEPLEVTRATLEGYLAVPSGAVPHAPARRVHVQQIELVRPQSIGEERA